jgi:hypothetical protein
VRPLVVRGCNCCWDVVPRVAVGEHLPIRTRDVCSALLVLPEGTRGEVVKCCSSVRTELKTITMWRSSMIRGAGWPGNGCRRGWTGSLVFMQLVPEEWAELEPGEAASRVKVGIEIERLNTAADHLERALSHDHDHALVRRELADLWPEFVASGPTPCRGRGPSPVSGLREG